MNICQRKRKTGKEGEMEVMGRQAVELLFMHSVVFLFAFIDYVNIQRT